MRVLDKPPGPLGLSVALPPSRNRQGCTSMHFGENQLLPNSISFSLLTTGRPRLFQQALVRSSMGFHPHFNLPMARSSGFGSIAWNYDALFRLAFASAPELSSLNLAACNVSPAHFSIGTPSRSKGRPSSRPGCLWVSDFRSVSLPSRGAFHLSLSVLCAIGHLQCLALDHGRPCFRRDSSCPALLGISSGGALLSATGFSPSSTRFSNTLRLAWPFLTPRDFSGRP